MYNKNIFMLAKSNSIPLYVAKVLLFAREFEAFLKLYTSL